MRAWAPRRSSWPPAPRVRGRLGIRSRHGSYPAPPSRLGRLGGHRSHGGGDLGHLRGHDHRGDVAMTSYGVHRYHQATRLVDLGRMLWLTWRAWRGDKRAALRVTFLVKRYTKESS